METNYVVLVSIFLLLVVVDCSGNDSKGNINEETGSYQNVDGKVDPVEEKVGHEYVWGSIRVTEVKDNGGDQTDGSEGGVDSGARKGKLNEQSDSNEGGNSVKGGKESSAEANGKTNRGEENGGDQIDVFEGDFDSDASEGNLNKQSVLNEDENLVKGVKESSANAHKGQEDSGVDAEGKTDDEKKENADDSVDPKKVSKEEEIMQDSVRSPLPPSLTMNDDFRVNECDSSNMCVDINKRFAACLRVAGNDSSDLSLLVRNKGKGPITLNISAPAFVRLEELVVELEENQDREVNIFIKCSGIGNLIVLKDGTGDGECSLDFKKLIPHNLSKSYVNFFSQTNATAFFFAAAILVLASRWMCKRFKWRQLIRGGLKHRRLDMELPVSSRTRREPVVNGEWDNSWGDNWDDEEAPVTPSLPITPSLSSKGLASRRLSKDGWTD